MTHNGHSELTHVQLRRYPNRRYYDCTRSQHLTLDEVYRLVCDGCQVTVVDSKTGEDITARVLAQLILDHDPLKLAAFPAALLHEVIRSNESLLREFIDKYFNRALAAFLKSQQEFERYMSHALGLNPLPGLNHLPEFGRGWAEMMMGPFARSFLAGGRSAMPADQEPVAAEDPAAEDFPGEGPFADDSPADTADLRQAVEQLKQELAELRKQVEQG